jgi:HK97 gp10 family phage protein
MANNVTIEGPKELSARIKKIGQTATGDIEQALVNSALFVERDAKIKAAVDTGRLRSSLTHTEENFGSDSPAVLVGTDVEYAKFVEFGTSKQAAKPYLYPALIENKSKILKEISKAFRKGCGL